MQSNSFKTPLFISVAFLGLSLIVFFLFYAKINNNYQETHIREKEWQSEELKREEIKTLDHSIKIIEEERALLETHFARSSDIVPFLDAIEELGRKAGDEAEVTSVDISKDQTALIVGMKASGSFGNLYKFLTLLENSPYMLEFAAVDIKREAGLSDSTVWDAVFRIKLLS